MDGIPLAISYTWHEARTRGATRRQVGQDGVRLGQGRYLSRVADPTLVTRCRAWARLLPPDAAFGLQTAAQLLGGPLPEPSGPVQVVLRPRPVPPRRRGLQVHERVGLSSRDVVDVEGLAVTSGPQTFLDLAAVLPPQDLLAVGDGLARAGHLSADRLADRLARADGVRGVVRARDLGAKVRPEAASRPECELRYWLLSSDLPEPELQVPVLDRWGRAVVHADLGYPEWKLALEFEGRQHAEAAQFGRDVDRYSLMTADGWAVLRFAGRHLGGPTDVVDRTRRALLARGWRP